jgi:hypothetical protein
MKHKWFAQRTCWGLEAWFCWLVDRLAVHHLGCPAMLLALLVVRLQLVVVFLQIDALQLFVASPGAAGARSPGLLQPNEQVKLLCQDLPWQAL